MATKGKSGIGHADPMKTKTGKTRLGPLSLKQLVEMLEKSSRPKDKAKIENRIANLRKILNLPLGKFKVVVYNKIN